jgi:hypothetical protein
MKILKTLLSLIALVAAAISITQATGKLGWNPTVVDLVTSGAGIVGTFGVAPFALSAFEKRICAAIATFASVVVAAHAAGTVPGKAAVFNIVMAGGAILGVLGRWNEAPTPPPAPPAT